MSELLDQMDGWEQKSKDRVKVLRESADLMHVADVLLTELWALLLEEGVPLAKVALVGLLTDGISRLEDRLEKEGL